MPLHRYDDPLSSLEDAPAASACSPLAPAATAAAKAAEPTAADDDVVVVVVIVVEGDDEDIGDPGRRCAWWLMEALAAACAL